MQGDHRWPFPRSFDGVVMFMGIADSFPSTWEEGEWKLEKGIYKLVSPWGKTAIFPQNFISQGGVTYEYAVLKDKKNRLYYWVRFAKH